MPATRGIFTRESRVNIPRVAGERSAVETVRPPGAAGRRVRAGRARDGAGTRAAGGGDRS